MNKIDFMFVLEAAILSYEGANPVDYDIHPTLSEIGVKLAKYLKEIKLS